METRSQITTARATVDLPVLVHLYVVEHGGIRLHKRSRMYADKRPTGRATRVNRNDRGFVVVDFAVIDVASSTPSHFRQVYCRDASHLYRCCHHALQWI